MFAGPCVWMVQSRPVLDAPECDAVNPLHSAGSPEPVQIAGDAWSKFEYELPMCSEPSGLVAFSTRSRSMPTPGVSALRELEKIELRCSRLAHPLLELPL